jgi:hypothetical protein
MAEVGLVGFARVALDVARSVLPDYRSKFSKHVFTQPQLLAIVCLMRYEGWTLRKAEVRLAEHRELREALELHKAPDYTTLHRFLNRLEEQVLVRALGETVRRGSPPSPHHAHHDDQHQRSQAIVAVDATGLSPGAISTFYVQRTQNRGGKPILWRKWLKWLVVVDTQSQLVLAQEACSRVPTTARRCSAPTGGCCPRTQPVRLALGRRGVRQRAQSSPCAREDRSAERDPGQARRSELGNTRLPSRDAHRVPT